MIEKLRHMVSDGSFVGTKLTGGVSGSEKTYEVKFGDDFYYEDPIDGSIAKQQVYYVQHEKTILYRPRLARQELGSMYVLTTLRKYNPNLYPNQYNPNLYPNLNPNPNQNSNPTANQ